MSVDERTKSKRLEMKLALARELARIVFVRDTDIADLADAAGTSESMPSRWASRKCSDAIGLADVVLIGERLPGVAHDLLRWAGDRLGLVVAKRLAAPAVGDHLAHVAVVAKETGEALAAYCEGIATQGGQFNDVDLARVDRELRDAEEALASLRAWVDDEREKRAVPRLGIKSKAA